MGVYRLGGPGGREVEGVGGGLAGFGGVEGEGEAGVGDHVDAFVGEFEVADSWSFGLSCVAPRPDLCPRFQPCPVEQHAFDTLSRKSLAGVVDRLVPCTLSVTSRLEVRPMNAVAQWVLPLSWSRAVD